LYAKTIKKITGVTVDTFKKHLDVWLMKEVPDQPKCDGYKAVATSIQSLTSTHTTKDNQ